VLFFPLNPLFFCYHVTHLQALFAAEKIGTAYQMPVDQRQDVLLDSLTILEANSVRVHNVLVRARRVFSKFFGHFFPKKEAPEDLLDLIQRHSGSSVLIPLERDQVWTGGSYGNGYGTRRDCRLGEGELFARRRCHWRTKISGALHPEGEELFEEDDPPRVPN
jgi:hypothetical protein